MKAIEDLGVSPLPWGAEQNGVPYVVDANGYNVATIDGDSIGQARSNTFLLKTAPKLYNFLRDAVIDVCHGCRYAEDDGYKCTNEDRDCHVQKWRAALAEARGEEIK